MYFELNKNPTSQWQDALHAVLKGKLIAWNTYIRKEEWCRIDNPSFHIRKPERKEQNQPTANRRKEIRKFRGEINEICSKKVTKSMKAKAVLGKV